MFVYNLKINGNKAIRMAILLVILISILILFLAIHNLYKKSLFVINDKIEKNEITNIEPNNYTNVLREVYDNVDTYVGQQINFTGYVYKLYDLKDTEFVLARDMLINSDSQSVVVGFLCSSKEAKNFEEGSWVNITGTIIKGYYHNEIPVIDITKIEKVEKPQDEFVYPPDDMFIPTSLII